MEPTSASTWQRLCPLGDWQDPVLVAMERVLDQDEVRAELIACEHSGRYPAEILARLREQGLGQIFAEDATAYHMNALNALAARRSGSLAITLGINGLALLPIYLAATPAQAARVLAEVRAGSLAAMLLSEWEHGSDLLATSTRAEPGALDAAGRFVAAAGAAGELTHYRLRGAKQLINGATRASLLITLVRTGERAPAAAGRVFQDAMGLSLVLVRPDDTVEPLERHRTLPVRAAHIDGVRFRDTVVAREALIGKEGEGYALVQKALSLSRGGISAFAVGVSNRALELAAAHARARVLYGQPILALEPVAAHLARLWALDLAITCLSLKAAAAVNALGQGAAHLTAVAKYACCELAEEAVAEGRRILGARSLIAGSFEPLLRDVLVLGVFDGTSHIMLEHVQRRLQQMMSGRDHAGADSVAELAAIYATPPARLLDVARRGGRKPWLPSIARHMAALAAHAGDEVAHAAAALAAAFAAAAERLVRSERWRADPLVRHQAATLLADLEAMAATLELAAPAVRAALGLAPVHWDRAAGAGPWQLAVALLGARAAASLRQLACSAGMARDGALDDIESRLVRHRDEAAAAARHALRATTQEAT